MCVLLVSTFSGCKNQPREYEQNDISYTVIFRIDRQNDVYYQLAQQVENYILGNRTIEEAKFNSFCLGINCFIRDELNTIWNDLYQSNKEVVEIIKDLTGITAKNEMETLRLSELSDNDLEQLMEDFYDLAGCCDRAKKNSFAYYVETQDFESNLYREELKRVKSLLASVDEITKVKGENVQ